jgi:hypothetical protein
MASAVVGAADQAECLTKEAIAVAVDRGWMLERADGVCLTDVGRDLAENKWSACGSLSIAALMVRPPFSCRN